MVIEVQKVSEDPLVILDQKDMMTLVEAKGIEVLNLHKMSLHTTVSRLMSHTARKPHSTIKS